MYIQGKYLLGGLHDISECIEIREEVFGEEYENFVLSLTKNLNKELWETVSFIHDEEVVTNNFFEVYNSYFEDYQIP